MTFEERLARLEGRVAALTEENAALKEENKRLRARVAELEQKLGENSSNSGKPPSSDPPSVRQERREQAKSDKPRGGQAGHKGHKRVLLAPNRTTDRFPSSCDTCKGKLAPIPEAEPYVHQIVEVPKIEPDVTHTRLHAVRAGT